MPRLSHDVFDVIGRGRSGVVVRSFDSKRNELVAAKIFMRESDASNELDILSGIKHPNIISILGTQYFHVDNKRVFGITFPLMGMNLVTLMGFDEYTKRQGMMMIIQTLRALAHIHDLGIIHMDVKAENIGVNFTGDDYAHFRLLDFGSCLHLASFTTSRNFHVTAGTMAPELREGKYSTAVDMYSAGAMFDTSNKKLHMDEFCEMTKMMTSMDPANRPDAKTCLEWVGECMCLLWVHNSGDVKIDPEILKEQKTEMIFTNMLTNCVHTKMDLFDCRSWNTAPGMQKIIALARSKDYMEVHSGFYMMHELAIEEVFPKKWGAFGTDSVISFIPYFLPRLDVGPMARHLFCRTIDVLSHKPGFMLTTDIMFSLRSLSKYKHCERNVLCVMSRCMTEEVLKWCQNDGLYKGVSGEIHGAWGSRSDVFDVFVARFSDDWHTPACNAALRLLRRPEVVVPMAYDSVMYRPPSAECNSRAFNFFSSLPPIRASVPVTPPPTISADCIDPIDDVSDNDEFLIELGSNTSCFEQ